MTAKAKTLLLVIVAGVLAPMAAQATRIPAVDVTPVALGRLRQAQANADEARRIEIGRASADLMARLRAGRPDPVEDARADAASGRRGLIWVLSLGGGGPAGLSCAMPSDFNASSLPIATVGLSDVPLAGEERALEQRALAYAVAYNHAVVAQDWFAYRDLCLPMRRASRDLYSLADPARWPPPPPPTWTRTRDLAQAVRQGTLAEVRRQLQAAGAEIDQPDAFGLTALGWAVLRRRHEVTDMLLAAGADPLAGLGRSWNMATTPLKLAILMRDQPSLDAFLTPQLTARLGPWPNALIEAAVSAGPPELVARMLTERHDPVLPLALRRRAASDPSGRTLAAIDAAEAARCWRIATPAAAEVRLVSVYEAKAPVHVVITARRRPLILALSAYDPVDWVVEARPGSRLVGVLALGYERPKLAGVPAGVPVLINDMADRCETAPEASSFGSDPAGLARLTTRVEAMTGRKVTGSSAAYSGGDFTIEP